MSQQNVELIRRATEAYNRGDIGGTLENWVDDAVLDWSRSRGPDARVLRGRGEIRSFMEQFRGTFEQVRLDLVDLQEVREGVVVVDNVAYMTGRDGIEAQARSAWMITVEDGHQTSLTLYQTKEDALEAAGLSE